MALMAPNVEFSPGDEFASPAMSEADFAELRTLVYKVTGIVLADSKRTMLASRLAPRLRALQLADFGAYRRKLSAGLGAERQSLINAVTTNKTSFYREGHQFEFIAKTVVPALVARAKSTGRREIIVWSAACSTGQEPWTIAMTLADALPAGETWQVRILATDIDTDVLARAEAGVYSGGELEGLPVEKLKRHFDERSNGGTHSYAIKPALRRWVSFRQLNFLDSTWPMRARFDFIMCRNASIYFDAPTQQKLFARLCDQLAPTGWLFVGHAEVLHWMNERLESQPGSIYRLRGATGAPPRIETAPPPPLRATMPTPSPSSPTRSFRPRSPTSESLEVVTINVGEAHSSTTPVEIKTLLGSCVAACLYDPIARVGGMNHFLLPNGGAGELDRTRFGAHAMEMLINALMTRGADRSRLHAKIFGGGNVLEGITRRPSIGELNAAFATDFLKNERIKLVASRLGGNSGVEVRFHPHTGRAFVRDISKDLINLEKEQATVLHDGDAELF